MLLYDNRNRLRLLLELRGSIYRRIWVPMLVIGAYSTTLFFLMRTYWQDLMRTDFYAVLMPQMDHPFAAQSFGTLMAFAVCFRTNIAWSRFWESCQESYKMFSKWGDAFTQLHGFINSTLKNPKDTTWDEERLWHARYEVTHYFTLLSAMAVERLTRGDIRRMQMRRQMGTAWAEQIVFREALRGKDLTGSKNLIPMRVLRIGRKDRAPETTNYGAANAGGGKQCEKSERRRAAGLKVPSPSTLQGHLQQLKDTWQVPVSVIGELSDEEKEALNRSKHRVALVLMWINELVTSLHSHLNVPPPILSRVFQELSNGALGYNQAEKLSDIPFPFVFTQLLALQVLFFAGISPLAFTLITGDSWLTPFISTIVVVSFWALNEIAKELENPFGIEANNVPLMDSHERFVEFVAEMHFTSLPLDREFKVDGAHHDDFDDGKTDCSDHSNYHEPDDGRKHAHFACHQTKSLEADDEDVTVMDSVICSSEVATSSGPTNQARGDPRRVAPMPADDGEAEASGPARPWASKSAIKPPATADITPKPPPDEVFTILT